VIENIYSILPWYLLIGAIMWVVTEWIGDRADDRAWFYFLCLVLSSILWPFFVISMLIDRVRK